MPYKDSEKQKAFQRENLANKNLIRRIVVLEFLGGKCARCAISDYRCLQIDHIKPILRARTDIPRGQRTVSEVYMDREDIENLQVLCANCHFIKTFHEDMVYYHYRRT